MCGIKTKFMWQIVFTKISSDTNKIQLYREIKHIPKSQWLFEFLGYIKITEV